jgi:endonuclease/exonuclease/phosphatase family metal-dependent hydrolase
VFFKAINHDGGEYGLAIISKYPIVKHELIKLSSGSAEQRILAHAEIDVNGTTVDFFVTHVSYDDEGGGASRAKQFKEIANKLANYDNFILTGDFNTRNLDEYSVIANSTLVNSKENNVVTYPDGRSPVDNIVYSTANFSDSGPNVVTNSYSDHYMLWSTLTYKG